MLGKARGPRGVEGDPPQCDLCLDGPKLVQISLRDCHPVNALRGELYELACMSNRNNLVWTDQDMNVPGPARRSLGLPVDGADPPHCRVC